MDKQLFHKTYFRFTLLCLVFMVFMGKTAMTNPLQAQSLDVVKSAFLFNFAKYTEWPESSFSNSQNHLRVGFIGATKLSLVFSKLVKGKNIKGHPLQIEQVKELEDITHFHLIFLGDKRKIEQAINLTKGKPILLISDVKEFINSGGIIEIRKKGRKVVFYLNLSQAKKANLAIHKKLEKLAIHTTD